MRMQSDTSTRVPLEIERFAATPESNCSLLNLIRQQFHGRQKTDRVSQGAHHAPLPRLCTRPSQLCKNLVRTCCWFGIRLADCSVRLMKPVGSCKTGRRPNARTLATLSGHLLKISSLFDRHGSYPQPALAPDFPRLVELVELMQRNIQIAFENRESQGLLNPRHKATQRLMGNSHRPAAKLPLLCPCFAR